MKKILNILIITLLALVSCKKDKDFSGVNVELKNVSVSTGVADMTYYAEYSYPANLKAVTMLLSENSAMSNVRTVQCDVGYLTIKATVTGLKENATYYYKLKYDTGFGVLESEVKSFVTTGNGVPTVTTGSVTNITQTSATCCGNVTSDGGYFVTTRGFCWNTSQNPTLSDAHNANGSGIGSYTVNVPALTTNTTYYVRAYAVNEKGTSYGDEVSFKTQGGGGGGTHEYVDLGLPSGLLWATCNVGADSPEDYGDYFAWGETTIKINYDWFTYQWCNGSYNTLTKYNTDSSYGIVDNKTVLELSDDAANANWGGDWRMPKYGEMLELKNTCTWTWTALDGKNGYRVTGTNGNSIFIPATGYRDEVNIYDVDFLGNYWSSSLRTAYSNYARYLYFNSDEVIMNFGDRNSGRTVRPVRASLN